MDKNLKKDKSLLKPYWLIQDPWKDLLGKTLQNILLKSTEAKVNEKEENILYLIFGEIISNV